MERFNRLVRRLPTWAVYLCGSLPLGFLIWGAAGDGLGVDPVKVIEHRLGELGLQFLLATLAVTPLRRVGFNLLKFRRALGLLAFSYISLHLLAWVWLDMDLRWAEMVADLTKRTYVIVGMIGFVVMLPLALTSTNAAIRRMGPKAWGRLHRMVYVAIIAGVLHLIMMQKVWTVEVLIYVGLTLGLLAVRLLPKPARPAQAMA